MINRQLRLQPDRSLGYNNFCGTVERLNPNNQSTTDLNQTNPILNLLFVLLLARDISSNRQPLAVAVHSFTM